MKRALAIALLLFLVAGSTSYAANDAHGYMAIKNETKYQAWVTTYNFARNQINYGWVNPDETVVHNNCCYVGGSSYYVRAEVKETVNGVMHQIFDTTIHVVPVVCRWKYGPGKYGNTTSYARVILRQGVGKTFFFDRSDPAICEKL